MVAAVAAVITRRHQHRCTVLLDRRTQSIQRLRMPRQAALVAAVAVVVAQATAQAVARAVRAVGMARVAAVVAMTVTARLRLAAPALAA